MKNVHDFTVSTADGKKKSLADYAGKLLLIVNTASKCGNTPQYAGLEELQQQYQDNDFSVIAFPSNQFKNQEPGTDAEIQEFCKVTYGVTFPVMAKIDVIEEDADPLFTFLAEQHGTIKANPIEWNFVKFLIDGEGNVARRYAANITPALVASDIDNELKKRD